MKVLLIGDGARENAYAQSLSRSNHEPKIYSIMKIKNPGIAKISEKSGGKVALGNTTDPIFVTEKAKEFSIDVAFVGPEEPQFQGVTDALDESGFICLGARKEMAEVERSKVFMRRLMLKYQIPGRLAFNSFRLRSEALAYLRNHEGSIVIKPTRQVGGKGVKVIGDYQEYLAAEKLRVKLYHTVQIFDRYMKDYADMDDKVLFEEKAFGPEYTVQTITDGRTTLAMPTVQDNKPAYEMDTGPMTGGMGSISGSNFALPFLTDDEYGDSLQIVEKIIQAMEREKGQRYKGVISGQMMLTQVWGPTVIEFYSRLGDPEAANVLSTLKTDLIDIAEAVSSEKLHKVRLEFEEKATVVKCVAPKGYPDSRDLASGHPVHIDESRIAGTGCSLLYGSVDLRAGGGMITGGSRICEILGKAETIPEASRMAEKAIAAVTLSDGWGVYHRPDIGSEKLLQSRIEQAEQVRRLHQYRKDKNLVGKRIDWNPRKGLVEERP